MRRRMTAARVRVIRALEREMEPVIEDFYREIRDLEKETGPRFETVSDLDPVAVGK